MTSVNNAEPWNAIKYLRYYATDGPFNSLVLLHVAPPLLFTVTSFLVMPTDSLDVPSPSLGVYQ